MAEETPTELPAGAQGVVAFWRDAGPGRWFRKDPSFDDLFRARYLPAHEAAARGQCAAWGETAEGALALLLLLDQFPRNAFRGTARMFATDARAREVAAQAIDREFDVSVEAQLRNFFYLPFMHSEALQDQQRAVDLARPLGAEALKFALLHHAIIARFGRFPHRNAPLGRTTTQPEQAFLDEGGFAG